MLYIYKDAITFIMSDFVPLNKYIYNVSYYNGTCRSVASRITCMLLTRAAFETINGKYREVHTGILNIAIKAHVHIFTVPTTTPSLSIVHRIHMTSLDSTTFQVRIVSLLHLV
jgi:hypothetical protein